MKFIKYFLAISIVIIIAMNADSQTSSGPSSKIKVEKVRVRYRELITDDKGAINRNQEELYALNKLVRDSVLIWARKFNLNTPDGLGKFAAYTGRRLDIKPGKRISVNFIDMSGTEESYYIWSLGNNRFKAEEAPIIKR
jgi:hypothetical protein